MALKYIGKYRQTLHVDGVYCDEPFGVGIDPQEKDRAVVDDYLRLLTMPGTSASLSAAGYEELIGI
jgi:hypothetical protein